MKKENAAETAKAPEKPICGIIMPISACTSNDVVYSAAHWQSMRLFLEDAIKEAGFEPKAVWEGEDQSIIHGRIVNNIAELPLMICVVCGCNTNVMIELGLRLMTDKPVLVIADDNFSIPFDVHVLKMVVMPTVPDYKDYQDHKERIKEILPKMLEPGYKTFSSYFKQVSPRDISGSEKVEVAQFMNEAKDAIQKLQTQIATLSSKMEDTDWEKRHTRALIHERMLQRETEVTEQDSIATLLKARLEDLRMRTRNLPEGIKSSRQYLEHLMEEFLLIQNEITRRGLEYYPSIRNDIARTRDRINFALKQSRE